MFKASGLDLSLSSSLIGIMHNHLFPFLMIVLFWFSKATLVNHKQTSQDWITRTKYLKKNAPLRLKESKSILKRSLMLHWLWTGEFENITDFEWLKPIRFDRLVGNATSQTPRPLVETYNASEISGSWGEGYLWVKPILTNIWHDILWILVSDKWHLKT